MSTEHPITPPPELVQRLCNGAILAGIDGVTRGEIEVALIQKAFAAGADQELEACCEWVHETFKEGFAWCSELRDLRRPKPPSLKQQALEALQRAEEGWRPIPDDCDTIRRALESLAD